MNIYWTKIKLHMMRRFLPDTIYYSTKHRPLCILRHGNPIGEGPKNVQCHALNHTHLLELCRLLFSFFHQIHELWKAKSWGLYYKNCLEVAIHRQFCVTKTISNILECIVWLRYNADFQVLYVYMCTKQYS